MKIEEFKKQVDQSIKKHFPDCYLKTGMSKKALGGEWFVVSFALGKTFPHGIIDNDPGRQSFVIDGIDEMEFDYLSNSGRLLVAPAEGSYYAYESVKLPLRKKKGTPEQIVKHIDRFFERFAKIFEENKHRLTDQHKEVLDIKQNVAAK